MVESRKATCRDTQCNVRLFAMMVQRRSASRDVDVVFMVINIYRMAKVSEKSGVASFASRVCTSLVSRGQLPALKTVINCSLRLSHLRMTGS
jgi:hypothetical protein